MVAALGRWAVRKARDYGYALGFFFQVLRETVFFVRRKQVAFRVLVLQILFTGVEALSVVSLMALSIGAVIIVEGGSILPRFGQSSLVPSILIVVITRELGPLLTAFIIAARSGTAIATELGNMVVSHEIEAYVSVGINPIAYLVVPRVLGVTISVIALTIYFNFFGLFGSYLVSQIVKPVPLFEYFSALLRALQLRDIISTLVKSLVFGVIISVVATFQGFKVGVSVTEIPRAAIRAVGQGFVLCLIADALITVVYYT
ncbi:MAG TPA: ABC transporter permease [Spirochaetia bacterium]|nr:ABC transporter permease [Spirochaetia bacterium]